MNDRNDDPINDEFLEQLGEIQPEQIEKLGLPDEETQLELSTLQKKFYQARIQKLNLENQQLEQDIGQRRTLSKRAVWLTLIWLGIVLAIVIVNGFWFLPFHMPDNVLIALIGSTTANVIGLLAIVFHYVFPHRK